MINKANHHCCVVAIDGVGILLEGASGSGKTSLALGLIEAARLRGFLASMVCDDQAILQKQRTKLVAHAPATIAGLVEIRGHGVVRIDHLSHTPVNLVARLVADEAIERMPCEKSVVLRGVVVCLIEVPQRHEALAIRIILARLGTRLI